MPCTPAAAPPPRGACTARRTGLRATGLALLAGVSAGAVWGGDAASAHYRLLHSTFDAGGGPAISTHYRLVSSFAQSGGSSQTPSGRVADRSGFVGQLNDPPRARPDTVPVGETGFVKVRVSRLLANDDDPEADRLGLRGFDALSAAGGTVTFDNGWLLYEPLSPFPGSDTFRYTIEDLAGNLATTTVTVLAAGTDPGPSQNFFALVLLPNGHRRISFFGIAHRTYTVERTDHLTEGRWEILATLAADAVGLVAVEDTTEPPPPQTFYRTVSP